MTTELCGRATFVFLLVFISFCAQGEYQTPNFNIEVKKPKGLRIWAQDPSDYEIAFIGLSGKVTKSNESSNDSKSDFEFKWNRYKPINGKWIFENNGVRLKVGNIINYHAMIFANRDGEDGQVLHVENSYVVNEFFQICSPTATRVRGGTACAGQTIFEDNFDTFRADYWKIEQYIPLQHIEYPFVTYQRLAEDPTVSVSGGHLRIAPRLQHNFQGFNNETIYTGSLNLLSGCTAAAEACVFQASGANIIPPIVSGRLTSKSFAFTYGTVHVRAKLPQGDWLYPDILLESFMKKYGSNGYASGLLRIAGARGNRHLVSGLKDYSNTVLYGGPIMDYQCRDVFIKNRARGDGTLWGDDYHVYTVRWAPDRITLSVDGKEWSRVEAGASGLVTRFPDNCRQLPTNLLALGSKMAPFDDHFTITLGLGAGGVTEFPDGTTSGNNTKPWSNRGRKAILNFWEDMAAWTSTWDNPQLLIDYIKVVAL